jgi:hypothetical protein
MKTLDLWMKEIKSVRKKYSYECNVNAVIVSNICDRALTLIDIVRQKDEALESINCSCSLKDRLSGHLTDCIFPQTQEAIALTEKLDAK